MPDILNKDKILELAQKYLDDGRVEKAVQEYQKLCAADPTDYRLKLKLAELYVRQKQAGEAIRVYQEVAQAYGADGFYLKAVTVYKNILRLNPSMLDVNRDLAELYEKMGLIKDAKAQYQILASLYDQKGNLEKLEEVRRRIVEIDPEDQHGRVRLAEVYQIQGKGEESVAQYENLASQLEKGNEEDRLIEMYQKVLAFKPETAEMVRKLVRIFFRRGKWKEVVEALKKSGDALAEDTEMVRMQADSYARLNQSETAKGRYLLLAELYQEEGKPEAALDTYMQILVMAAESESEIAPLVEAMAPGRMAELRETAAKKRLQGEKSGEVSAPGSASAAGPTPSSAAKPGERIKSATASYELGMAYVDMGLAAEGRAELVKAYGELAAAKLAGESGPEIDQKMAAIVKRIPDIAPPSSSTPIEVTAVPESPSSKPRVNDAAKVHPVLSEVAKSGIIRSPIPAEAAEESRDRPSKYAKLALQKERPVTKEKKRRISFV